MVDIVGLTNKIFSVKGNLLNVNFSVDGKDLKAFVPDDQLFIAIKEILLNRQFEYLQDFELSNYIGKTIVDAGAHVGLFSLVASVFAKKVISIEPNPINYRLLEINKIINNAENIVTINKALWWNQEAIKIFGGNLSSFDSIFRSGDKYYEVSTVTLDNIVDDMGSIDLLKLDIEGAEFEIFKKLNANTLKKIKCIFAEVHLNHGNANQIESFLTENEYEMKKFYSPLYRKSNSFSYSLKVKNFVKLKLWINALYFFVFLFGMEDKSSLIIFAKEKK